MTGLRPALAGLFTWAIHFFVAYGLMLAFPEASVVRWLTLGLGLACLAFLASLLRRMPQDPIVMPATLLVAVAIIWQSIVGLF